MLLQNSPCDFCDNFGAVNAKSVGAFEMVLEGFNKCCLAGVLSTHNIYISRLDEGSHAGTR